MVPSLVVTLVLIWTADSALGFDWSGRIDLLADSLEAPSPTVRRQTLEKLGTYPSSHVASYLLSALDDENLQVRVTAARILGRGRVAAAVPVLSGWLTEQEEEMRTTAAIALGRIGDLRAVTPLSRVMSDSSPSVRRVAVEALASLGTDAVVTPLIGRLGDSHPRVRQAAATGLGQLLSPEAVVPLVSRLQDPVPPVRLAVISALARIGDPRASAALVQSLRDRSPEVRASALNALARLRSTEAVVPAVGLLSDENETVRARAVATLGAIGGERAIEALIDSLDDTTLSPAAVNALVEVGPPAVVPLCDVIRQSTDRLAREAALRVLVRIGDPRAAPTVLEELETGGGGIPEVSLVNALGALPTREGLLPLLERLDHETPMVRQAALLALDSHFDERRPEPRATEALLRRAVDGEPAETLPALLLLGRVGGPGIAEQVQEILDEASRSSGVVEGLLVLLESREESLLRQELVAVAATEWPLHAAAIRALGAAGTNDAGEALLELLSNDRRAALRHEAALALGRIPTAQVVGGLTDLLRSPEPIDRSAVILALGRVLSAEPSEPTRLALEVLVAEGETSLSLRAADALARSGQSESAEVIAGLLSRPEVVLRRKAAEVLGELGGEQARQALIEALGDDDTLVRGLAAWSLGKIEGEDVTEALIGALDDRGWSVAINAAGALARRADPSAAEAICAALEDTRGVLHLEANLIIAAAATGAPCARERALGAFRQGRPPIVRAAGARTISRIASESAGPDDQRPVDPAISLLRTCASEDESPAVQRSCQAVLEEDDQGEAERAGHDWIEFYLYSSGSRRLRPRGRYLLILPSGLTKAGITDANGFAREAPVTAGEYEVHDPSTSRSSRP